MWTPLLDWLWNPGVQLVVIGVVCDVILINKLSIYVWCGERGPSVAVGPSVVICVAFFTLEASEGIPRKANFYSSGRIEKIRIRLLFLKHFFLGVPHYFFFFFIISAPSPSSFWQRKEEKCELVFLRRQLVLRDCWLAVGPAISCLNWPKQVMDK